tara:strand:+ start:112 stop:819 length:708 start_codon:yes stop_codon:yes gene_type:complete
MAYIIRKPNLMIIKLLDMSFSLVSYPNLINLNKNYFYIDIPKSGSSFIRSSIIQNDNSIFKISYKYPHSALFKRTLLINSIKEKKIIAFIRDPIERFCSVVRQKILGNKYLRGFSPTQFNLPFIDREFYSYEIEDLIKKIDRLPMFRTDRHIVPQFKFIRQYINHPNFEVFHTSQITKKLLEIGIEEASFPNKEISLKTSRKIFNKDHLNYESIKILKNYYREDYKILEKIKKSY